MDSLANIVVTDEMLPSTDRNTATCTDPDGDRTPPPPPLPEKPQKYRVS